MDHFANLTDKLSSLLLTYNASIEDKHSGKPHIAICPDGQTLVSVGYDKAIKLWNLHSGALLRTFKGHPGDDSRIAVSPDGRMLALGSSKNVVQVWDLHSGTLLRTLTGHTTRPRYGATPAVVAISPDGQTLVSSGQDNTKVWNLHSGELLR